MLIRNQPPPSIGRSLGVAEFAVAAAAHEAFLRGAGGARAILRFVEAPGVDSRRRLLNDADFTGANLEGGLFAGCHLERAALHCADLSRADLRAANLRRADLRGAVLAGAMLNGAVMDEADMRAAYIALTDSDGCIQILPRRLGRMGGAPGENAIGADFTNCALRGARLCGANLKGANFSGAVLDAADLTGAKLTGAVFHDTVMTGLIGGGALLSEAQRGACVFDPDPAAVARAERLLEVLRVAADWVESRGGRGAPAVLDQQDLRPLGGAFRGRALPAVSMRGARATGLDFSGGQYQGAVFDEADLRGALFEGADLRGASFRGARLSHARFGRADLTPLPGLTGKYHAVSFDGAALDRADFTGAVRESVREPAVFV